MEKKIQAFKLLMFKAKSYERMLRYSVESTKKAQEILALLPHGESDLRSETLDALDSHSSSILLYSSLYDLARKDVQSFYLAELKETELLNYIPSALELLME